LVWAKALALAPVSARPVTLKAALPELVRLRVSAALVAPTVWLEKVRLLGERLAAGAVPVPVSLTLWALWKNPSVRETAALKDPVALGVKVTLMLQSLPAGILDPQLLVSVKSAALVPETVMLVTLKAAPPELVRVIVWPVLVVPTD
jgi:hypothetical protein